MKQKLAVLYARFSPRPNPQECDSIKTQLDRMRAWCVAFGYEVIGEYADAALSGKSAEGRPDLELAIAHACKSKAALLIYDLSRLSRKTRDALDIAERLHRARADLVSITQQIDTTTPYGELFFTVMAAINHLNRRVGNMRTADAMRHYQDLGRRMGRSDRTPFGKKPKDGAPDQIEDNPEELSTMERMKSLRAEGKTYRQICQVLDEEGRQRRGKTWDGAHAVVRVVLSRSGVR